MKRFAIIVITLTSAIGISAAAVLSGRVSDPEGKAVPSVMVRAEETANYTLTDDDGRYKLQIDSSGDTLAVTFSAISYKKVRKVIKHSVRTLNIVMEESSVNLKEVVVKVPSVRMRNDTVSYRLASFAGKDDITLRDALGKVPGINVAETGAISYNGKTISDFYVEGLDMLGGKYNIVTGSLPADNVSTVEVLNNHQDVKIDRKIFSDKVALNIRLKTQAKLRPTGSYEAKAGAGQKFLYQISGAGMLFKNKFQSLISLKSGNIEEFSHKDFTSLYSGFGGGQLSDNADRILGIPGASSPPLNRRRWGSPLDMSASVNFITKTSQDATLRANAGYSHMRYSYGYTGMRSYFTGGEAMNVEQIIASKERAHNPFLSMLYKVNSDKLYLVEEFSGNASFADHTVPVTIDGNRISQRRDLGNYDIRNCLNAGWKRGRIRWNASSTVEFMATPHGKTSVTRSGEENSVAEQIAKTHSFMTSEQFSGAYDFGRSRISVPVNFTLRHDRVHTELAGFGTIEGATNSLTGTTMNLSIAPSYYFSTPYNRFVLNLAVPIEMKYIDARNSGSKSVYDKKIHWQTRPSFCLNYAVSASSAIKAGASFSETVGDLLDFLVAPIMKDYMSVSYRTGTLSRQDKFSSSLRYDFKLPLSMWFANAEANYSLTHNNLLSRQNIENGIIISSDYLSPHSSDAVSISAGVSKFIEAIKTKISLNASWNWSRNRIEQNGIPVNYYGEAVSFSPSLSSSPVSWFELAYGASVSETTSRYLGGSQSFSMQNHDISLKLFPLEGFTTKATAEISRHEVSESNFKTIALFDVGLTYSHRKLRFGIEVRNIFDCRSYSYTVFSALDRFTYDYTLRGREFIFTVTLMTI